MMNIQTIQHVADCVPLYMPHSLYLKPLAKLNISVALPLNKMGKSISNLDIMEKLSHALKPDKFLVLKVSKTTVDFIRFEAELDDRSRLRSCINRLDGVSLKISGFHESFRVRVSEAKDEFPTRHDWDSFFRDAHKMDEMKAGERPDTIHITHLPIKWFCPRHMENDDNVKPSEGIFKRIFEKFGCIRCVDIPICDPYRNKMNTDINGMKTFGFDQEILFEAYVQFDEYVGFVRAMDEFRGMKLVKKFIDKTQAINIGVTFDTTKHLSDAQIQRRERVRKHIIAKAKAEEEEVERKKKMELLKLEEQKQKEEQEKLAEMERQREREEKRKEKHLKKIQEKGSIEISQKIRVEERKLMIAQRKLESIRILEQLFSRIKLKHLAKHGSTSSQKYQMEMARDTIRERLVEKYKTATEKLLSDQQKLVDDIKNKTPLMGLLKSKKEKEPIPSIPKVGNSTGEAVPAIANPAAAAVAAANVAAAGNPFKTIAALGANYNTEAASEWMKSLSMFSYGNIPALFPGLAPMYRPPTFPVSVNYRGFAPRIRGRGRGRGGRGRGYEGQSSSSHYSKYHYNNDDRDRRYDDDEDGGSYHKSYSRGRRYSRSRSRSRDRRSRSRSRSSRSRSRDRRSRSRSSRSRSRDRRSRSRSRSRSRHRHYSKRSRSRSRSYSRSESKSRSRSRSRDRSRDDKNRSKSSRSKSPIQQRPPEKVNRKLVSTRRSRSSSHESRSRSRSRTHSKRSWSRRDNSSRDRRSSPAPRKVVIETEELVKSAEIIKSTIEKDMQERIRNEKREIRETFTKRHKDVLAHNATNQTIIINNSSSASNVDSGHATSEHSANESAQDKNSSRDERDERDDRDDKRSSRRDRYHSTSSDHHRHSSYKHNSERENSSQNTSSGDRYSRHNSTSDNHSNNKHPTTEHNSRRRSSERSSKQRRSSERSGTTIKHKSPPPVSSHKKTSGRNLRLASLDRSPSC